MNTHLIIDGLNLFMRHFVVNPTMSESGDHVGGMLGFLKALSFLINRTNPNFVYVIWEGGGSTKRRALDSSYKNGARPKKLNRYYEDEIPNTVENRNDQISSLIKVLTASGIKQVYVNDCEADDVIGYMARYKVKNDRSVIVSSDRDLYQLLSKKIIQWSPGQKKYITPKTVIEKYGISVENFCTARAFIGDPSDGIKGVPRAGFTSMSKRFPQLMSSSFSSVENIVESAKECLAEKKLKLFENIVNNESIAKKNWRLMYLDTNNLSHEQIKKIEFLLEKSEPPRDKLKLIKIFRDFGINNFDIDTFFSSISSIKVKNDRR